MKNNVNSVDHWQQVYRTKNDTALSWHQSKADLSFQLISGEMPLTANIIDIGSGTSTLLDELLIAGYHKITATDISHQALQRNQQRLLAKPETAMLAKHIHWYQGDVGNMLVGQTFDLWHDRAVLHFLLTDAEQMAYRQALHHHVKTNGHVVIAVFAPNGPLKCSGLPIIRHDDTSIQSLVGGQFTLVNTEHETHQTPWGSEQEFCYYHFVRL